MIPGARNVRHMDFLWVHWFGEVPGYRSGFRRARLPAIGFVESTDDFAFSFVDPANVVCGCHLIPASTLAGVLISFLGQVVLLDALILRTQMTRTGYTSM